MNEFFPVSQFSELEKEELLVEVLSSLFYLPPSVLKKPGVEAKSFQIMEGTVAAKELKDLRDAGYPVHGDIRLDFLCDARHAAISERSYKGHTYYVYKLWHPGHPGNNQTNERNKPPLERRN